MTSAVVHISPWYAFRQTAARFSARQAFAQGPHQMSFGEWWDAAGRYSVWFARHGLPQGGRVLLWMQTSPELAAALFGTWGAGGIPVLIDPRSATSHLEHALRVTSPSFIVTDRTLPAAAACPHVEPEAIHEGRRFSPDHDPKLTSTDPATIVFTSGSTGPPKGVTQSHGNLLRGCLTVTRYLETDHHDRILCTVPWSFDYGFGQLLTAAVRGTTIILPLTSDPFAMCEAIDRHGPTVLAGIPSVFTYLLRGVSPFGAADLRSITTVTNTGGTIPAPLLDELIRRFPQARIFLNYGLTETYRTTYLPPALINERPTSIGRAIPSVDVLIVREDGTTAKPDEEGEIVHRGDFVCLGYWNDQDGTARALRPDPLAPAGCPLPPRVMFTGDLGALDEDGFLYFRGRRDNQLKSMGVRVNPGEIEDLLYGSGLVQEAAVVGLENDLIGHEICAAVVPADDALDLVPKLAQHAKRVMSPFMVPRRFFVRSHIQKTVTGKIDYPSLRADLTRESGGTGFTRSSEAVDAPRWKAGQS